MCRKGSALSVVHNTVSSERVYVFPPERERERAMASDTETFTDRCDALSARGNVLYGEVATGGGGNTADKIEKLRKAQEKYKEALELCCDSHTRASCCKNLGALHYLWAKVKLDMMPSWMPSASLGGAAGRHSSTSPPGKLSAVTEHLGEAIRFFVRAHVEGARAGMPEEWMKQVGDSLVGLVAWAAEQSKILAFPEVPILRSVCEDLARVGRDKLACKVEVEAEALANLEMAICLFNDNPDGMVVRMDGVPANVEQPFSHASRLLKSLPPSSTSTTLHERLSAFHKSLHQFYPSTQFWGMQYL